MNEINDAFALNNENRKHYESTGKIQCKYCNGCRINPAYEEVDKILKAIFNCDGPCCLHCFGLAEIDWIDYANGNYKRVMRNLKKRMKELFLIEIHPFLQYVQYGEVYFSKDSGEWINYDPANDCWNYSEIILGSLEGHRAKNGWIDRFKTDGYCDIMSIVSYKDIFHFYCQYSRYYFAADIKANLISSKVMTIDELHEIKKVLKVIGFSIEDLNWIKQMKNSNRTCHRNLSSIGITFWINSTCQEITNTLLFLMEF
jgi:hypothetical protein